MNIMKAVFFIFVSLLLVVATLSQQENERACELPGITFVKDCNTCVCNESGDMACTMKRCKTFRSNDHPSRHE
ncbi:hypothetical protein J437_LFUL006832 [Ladona fulva]|uniref:Pacifastin domain-containing protein n=1 Tax=Ladona fulva TaxID=123851 RepID=A0A8K0K927_LADFU|nr:hypothetical protein J437_LFUL006832 [Ladona fulva]